jgi:hypothetical protein
MVGYLLYSDAVQRDRATACAVRAFAPGGPVHMGRGTRPRASSRCVSTFGLFLPATPADAAYLSRSSDRLQCANGELIKNELGNCNCNFTIKSPHSCLGPFRHHVGGKGDAVWQTLARRWDGSSGGSGALLALHQEASDKLRHESTVDGPGLAGAGRPVRASRWGLRSCAGAG